MQSLITTPLFNKIYSGRRVLVTGHTGFKGSWLALWLKELGASITCIALPPEAQPNHWDLLKIDVADYRVDIRDAISLKKIVYDAQPEIVFQ
jgi:CDP-glucose 4,6-dehydratase